VEHLVHVVEDVPVQMDSAAGQVRVDGEATQVPRAMDVVEIIVAEFVPHVGPIPHGVSRSDIPGLLGDAGEIAVFDNVVVTGIGDALVRGIVDKAMAHAVAHAAEVHRRFVGLLPAGVVVNIAVLDGVLSPAPASCGRHPRC